MKLGVISNWDDRLRPLLQVLGLEERFDSIVISCEVGDSKPTAVIFETAMNQLDTPANAILHVGDSLQMDLVGARRAGLNALQIEREKEITADWQITSLTELLARV